MRLNPSGSKESRGTQRYAQFNLDSFGVGQTQFCLPAPPLCFRTGGRVYLSSILFGDALRRVALFFANSIFGSKKRATTLDPSCGRPAFAPCAVRQDPRAFVLKGT
jgi:hypothetical protein